MGNLRPLFSGEEPTPLCSHDSDWVATLLRDNPHRARQLRQQQLDSARVVEFHRQALMARCGNDDKPVWALRTPGYEALLGIAPEHHHSEFFGKRIYSLNPLLGYRLANSDWQAAVAWLIEQIHDRQGEVVWMRVDEAELHRLVGAAPSLDMRYCGTVVRLSRSLLDWNHSPDTGDWTIRPAAEQDLEWLVSLVTNHHHHNYLLNDPHLPDHLKQKVFANYVKTCFNKSQRPLWVIASPQGEVAGMVMLLCPADQSQTLGRKVGILDLIVVNHQVQGKGLGWALLCHGLRELKVSGYEVVELKTMLDNLDAVGFYERAGFQMLTAEAHLSFQI